MGNGWIGWITDSIRHIVQLSTARYLSFEEPPSQRSSPSLRRTLINSLTNPQHAPRIPRTQVPLLSPLHKTLNTWRIAFRTACYEPHTGPRFNTKEKERQRLGRLQRQETMYGLAGDYDDN
jgi:hypothetical protein